MKVGKGKAIGGGKTCCAEDARRSMRALVRDGREESDVCVRTRERLARDEGETYG